MYCYDVHFSRHCVMKNIKINQISYGHLIFLRSYLNATKCLTPLQNRVMNNFKLIITKSYQFALFFLMFVHNGL